MKRTKTKKNEFSFVPISILTAVGIASVIGAISYIPRKNTTVDTTITTNDEYIMPMLDDSMPIVTAAKMPPYGIPMTETLYSDTETAYSDTASVMNTTPMDVPSGDTSFKAYMDYRTITDTDTPQYKLQQHCWTDCDGFRRQTDDYVIALGSYYSTEIGDRFEITLDTGTKFTAILGDQKANRDTDPNHQYTPVSDENMKNVIEFIVDTQKISHTSRQLGDMSNSYGFSGNITSIEKIED